MQKIDLRSFVIVDEIGVFLCRNGLSRSDPGGEDLHRGHIGTNWHL